MKSVFNAMHPTFESLSAFADDTSSKSTATRVGRHVAVCQACATTVSEVRALGSSARNIEPPRPPATLWPRIESAARENRWQPSPPVAMSLAISAGNGEQLGPIHQRSSRRTQLGVVVAAAAAILAIVAWPSQRSLQASGVRRLTFSPGRPVPGGLLKVRYMPISWLEGAPRLLLVGRYSPSAMSAVAHQWRSRGALVDSLATLRPASDGAYETTLRLPADFRSLDVTVVDSVGEGADSEGPVPWTIVGGTRAGAPSLASFASWMWWAEESYLYRISYDLSLGNLGGYENPNLTVADSLTKYFPQHPLGWAVKRDYGVKKGVFDYFRFFETAQRKYASFYDKLMPQTSLDAERLHDMALFATSIDEPEHAALWVKRLVREHPEDPRGLGDLAEMLHQVELAYPASAADSVRPWLSVLDSLYVRSSPHLIPAAVLSIVRRYADADAKERWRSRTLREEGNAMFQWSSELSTPGRNVASSSLRADDRSRLQELATRSCTIPSGKYSFYGSNDTWQRGCIAEHAYPFGILASDALARGDVHLANALADSSIHSVVAYNPCVRGRYTNLETRARARLAVGDRAGAMDDVVRMFAGTGRTDDAAQTGRALNTARSLLGSNIDSARFLARTDSAYTAWVSCEATRAPAVQARRDRMRARQAK